jgi:hypothetical protein
LSTDVSTADRGRPDATAAPAATADAVARAVDAVDWFGLTESNVPPAPDRPSPPERRPAAPSPAPQDPGFASVGGLRP